MRRSLLIVLALLAVTCFEFIIYPGHNFLGGETSLLVPMLQRLDTPGFLSRDLVASHPIFAYTIYDEVTLLLHTAAHLTFELALTYQQELFRFASVLGVFLLARSVQTNSWACVATSAAVNAVTHLSAPNAFVTSPDPTPVSFALSLVLLAAGFLVSRFTLLAGLVGGIALLYDPVTAMPFWFIVFGLAAVSPAVRRSLRPVFVAFLIFSLLLGNFSQMQAGIGDGQDLAKHMDASAVELTRIRTPWIWISQWVTKDIWSYLFAATVAVLALVRLRAGALARIVLAGLVSGGLLSALAACVLLGLRLQFATGMPLAANLTLTIVSALILACAACGHSIQTRKWKQGFSWALFVACSLINPQVLNLSRGQLALSSTKSAVTPELRQLAQWADENTWGSSMFEFPDAGKGTDPGVFRALSRRALWADWQSGVIADYSDRAGRQWWQRWQTAGSGSYSPTTLTNMLTMPVDYYVLDTWHSLSGVKPVFANSRYFVYDAQDLRKLTRSN